MKLSLFPLVWATVAQAVTLTVNPSGTTNASSPLLYGFMFEDINYSGDGGIHGQLLRNNGFQGTTSNDISVGWGAYGTGATIAVDTTHPLSTAIPKSLRLTVASGATGQVGVTNAGYWGISVQPDTYAFYFWVQGAYSGTATVSLVSTSGTVFATKGITITSVAGSWTYFETTFPCSQTAPDENNVLRLTFDATKIAGSSIYVDLLQLFPVTYKQRYNGLKPDIAGVLADVKASFLRFPGGNNLEGSSPANRWKWNETVGPVHMRPGRQGDWSYPNTDALGLHEYFQWCEDMALVPVLGVWAGLSLGGGIVTGSALTPYIQDVLNEIEYITGSASTTYGARRVANGRADPWALKYVEIGNEDQYNGGLATYGARFEAFRAAIAAKYPSLTIIASTDQGLASPKPAGIWVDIHHYLTPDQFVALFNEFDNWDRSLPVFVGEYAVTRTNTGDTMWWPSMLGAVAEAVYMIGLERNSDIVKMAAYAPLLERLNHQQWVPDLVQYSSHPGNLTRSSSYWIQNLFSVNRGTHILPVSADASFKPVYWVASRNSASGAYFVKLANYGSTAQSVTVKISGGTAATMTTVAGASSTSRNEPGLTAVSPVVASVAGTGTWTVSLPAWGVGVLKVT